MLHVGKKAVQLKVGEKISATVDYNRRRKIIPNHTFTHVLNFGLKKVLGDHVAQKVYQIYVHLANLVETAFVILIILKQAASIVDHT